jgi:Glycosyltransferase family 87
MTPNQHNETKESSPRQNKHDSSTVKREPLLENQQATETSIFRGELLFIWVLWAAILFLFYHFYIHSVIPIAGCDYPKHWEASVGMFQGESPYAPENYIGFNYPLFATIPFLYLAFVNLETGEIIWDICNILMILGGALIIVFGFPKQQDQINNHTTLANKCKLITRKYWLPLVLFFVISFQPSQRVLLASNIEPLCFFLSAAFCTLYIRGKDSWAGTLLAMFALVKLAPVLLIIPLLVGKRYKILASCMGTFLLYGLLLLVTGYWQWEIVLYRDIVPWIAWKWQGISCSIHYFIATHFFSHVLETSKTYEKLILSINLILMVIYGVYLACWWRWSQRNEKALLIFGYGMVLIFTPLLEINHFLWTFPAFFLMIHLWSKGELKNGWTGFCFLGWFVIGNMMTMNYLITLFPIFGSNGVHTLWTTMLLIHVISLGALAWSAGKPQADSLEQDPGTEMP